MRKSDLPALCSSGSSGAPSIEMSSSATGENRNQLVLMMVIDMAVYHIFCIHNPQKLSQVRKDRYERAVEWMKAVADEDISIEGAPLLPEEQRAGRSDFRIQSNRKRTNHW